MNRYIIFITYYKSQTIYSVDPKDYSWDTRFSLPKMRIEGNYHMQGRILVIPLNGHGKCFFEPSKFCLKINNTTYSCVYFTSSKVYFKIIGIGMPQERRRTPEGEI